MKVTPWSMAVRTIRMAVCSLGGKPRWNPPSPSNETVTPVRPSFRGGIPPSAGSLMSASSGAPGCGRLGTSAANAGLDQGIAAAAAVNAMNSRRLHPLLTLFGGHCLTEDGMRDLGVGVCHLRCTSSHLDVPDENLAVVQSSSRVILVTQGKIGPIGPMLATP